MVAIQSVVHFITSRSAMSSAAGAFTRIVGVPVISRPLPGTMAFLLDAPAPV